MSTTTYPPTQPGDAAPWMRVSDFHRDRAEHGIETVAGATRLTSLTPSVLHDLQRFATGLSADDHSLELLEVLAAAIRHGRALCVHVQHQYRVAPITVFPAVRQMHCPVRQEVLLGWRLPELQVLHVEPARIDPFVPGQEHAEVASFAPLGPLLWELALRGSRGALLPEIAGTAAYRIPPGVDLGPLDLSGSLAAAVQRLRRQTTSVREMEQWPGFDRERATRMLNGLYLQAALIVSRTHPAATNEGWSGGEG